MSSCPINNSARVIPVIPVQPLESVRAANYFAPHKTTADVSFVQHTPTLPWSSPVKAAGDETGAVSMLIALVNSLFTQLMTLVSDKKDKTLPLVPPQPQVQPQPQPKPQPQVQPQVMPRVLPEPVKPGSAATIAGLSDKRNGAKPGNIWSGFRQGPDGNCVTVSAIKAAMHKFGQSPTDIYKEVKKDATGYRVTMRDDVVVTLSDRELVDGARGAKFYGEDKGMLKDAQFLFAVSAKRAQMENNDRTAGKSFSAAIRSLNDGEDESGPGEGFKRLGLQKHMRKVSVRDLANGMVGMCNRTRHSVAVINGHEELWGKEGRAPTRGDAIALV
ncbi:hypothetical protein [Pseudomonas sp. ICMP 460]|uniref:hypothetical protein n=1 Tax=Pseudomonas sp. ICMP 460 TaxID=1718917 RepID=UPI0015AE8DE9|nr:hypothetical protein [Pseudomonas sp. ICMP 460]